MSDSNPPFTEECSHTIYKEKKLIIKDLIDYSLVPKEEIKRKMDFFYAPYNAKMHTNKAMFFGEDCNHNEPDNP